MAMDFKLQTNTLWSFYDRGSWANHGGAYPGNWSPNVPRNIILRYSKENDIVLDQFVGSGTTLVEAKLLNRGAIGCDVNDKALNISYERVKEISGKTDVFIRKRDARNLYGIKDNSVDLICTHPPKDSKPYHLIYSQLYSREVSNKNHAFYFKKEYMKYITEVSNK